MAGTYVFNFFLIILLIVFSLISQAKSEVYTVGGEDNWDTGTDYVAWSQQYSFNVGDILVFNYVMGQHNVYEMTQDTYRSCNSSTGVLRIYHSGNDRVTLTEAKQYWFICQIPGHCLGGMKFGVEAKQVGGNGVPSPPPTPTPTPGSEQGQTNAVSTREIGIVWICIIALGISVLM
ncbi:hypothetical protein GIB67_015822 [Kingdonia uniflora]|uniref:Phytocyanin domain-containing protein n=1 Tax=Kingdonia uniflora TaxID=39325 RepID=A0A7J7NUY9_9MAGN|nr:hypothetical protein GIB67_015822 [Kingdonia uniflora]